ncbi:50S ribosome-binding GTPase [Actinotalea sp. M2MS4P-6]|uniref:GTPase n=1 Tax=Actinotalea sp. M2MS4P-6 TaxID=2983762 RepID=UPI0021E434F1|nr:GTPase [Actinotalea sp. M2MS4P-6]MCV2396210.1 50S ribosome-binding GTPase [Actinotalea sp. M2MS4P-6]
MVLIVERLEALTEAVAAGHDVLPVELVDRARGVGARAGDRLRLSEEHTVVAVAGATGSGKSSIVNALVGGPVAKVDVLRPTTSAALAAVWGADGSTPLLDWLGVRERVVVAEHADAGLVLLDLPDHDSVRTEHRLEAERLIALVDLMVWVLDPQKYADAAVHERYLRNLRAHRDVLLVVLNQSDRLTPGEVDATVADARRLLAEDGLDGVPVLPVSARTGAGVDALRDALGDAARRREARVARLRADVVTIAGDVLSQCGAAAVPRPTADRELVDAFAEAAGVPTVVSAVEGSARLSAHLATGWPPTRWVGRLRADPLHTLHLAAPRAGARDDAGAGEDVTRTSLPAPGPAELARAAGAIRDWRERATDGLPDAWVLAARGTEPTEALADELDRAVARTHVTRLRRPLWWRAVGVAQWLLLAVAVGGLGWLGALAGLDALRMPSREPPEWHGWPVPTLMLLAGVVAGLVLAGVARLVAGAGARRQARRATAALRRSISDVADRVVVEPVAELVERHEHCRAAALRAAAEESARRRGGGR